MVTSVKGSQPEHRFNWRALFVGVLAVVGMAALLGYSMVHWVEQQVLTTENWVEVVGPIPKDDTVATAISTYSVNRLFTATDLENNIAEALPDRAAFLAPVLSDQLQTRLTNRTKQVVQSDRFQNIWEVANREASERLLTKAREPQAQDQKATARFSLDLPALKETITSLLNKRSGQEVSNIQPASSNQNVGFAVSLRTSIEKIHSYIRLVDFLNATLLLLGVVCVLGAIIISRSRRRLLLILSSTGIVLALLQIIGVNAVRPYILNQVQTASFRPAVSVVYDSLLASFRSAAVTIALISLLLFLIVYMLHKPFLARSKAITEWLNEVQRTVVWKRASDIRYVIGKYRYQIMFVVAVLGLAIVAFSVEEFTWAVGARSVLFIILAVECISLAGLRPGPRGSPMKQ